jgi:hypothetical protein
MQTLEVSRRLAIWTIVGVCALSAAIGSSITLLAETGPQGKPGESGPRGPRGREGPEGAVEGPDFGFLESEIEGVAEELGDLGATEARVEELERDLVGTEETVSEICLELELFCSGLHSSG